MQEHYQEQYRFVNLYDLSPGEYNFQLKAANYDEKWQEIPLSLHITIHPPWYRSNAAISGYFIAMIMLVLWYVRIRTEKLRKDKILLEAQVADRTAEIHEKNEKIIEMERLKTRFFTDVSHEIRTPLSLPIQKLKACWA